MRRMTPKSSRRGMRARPVKSRWQRGTLGLPAVSTRHGRAADSQSHRDFAFGEVIVGQPPKIDNVLLEPQIDALSKRPGA